MKLSEIMKVFNRGILFDLELIERGLPIGFSDDTAYLTYDDLLGLINHFELNKYEVYDLCVEDPFGLGRDALCITLVDDLPSSYIEAAAICKRSK